MYDFNLTPPPCFSWQGSKSWQRRPCGTECVQSGMLGGGEWRAHHLNCTGICLLVVKLEYLELGPRDQLITREPLRSASILGEPMPCLLRPRPVLVARISWR